MLKLTLKETYLKTNGLRLCDIEELSRRRMNIIYHHQQTTLRFHIQPPAFAEIQSNTSLQLRFESRQSDKTQHTCFIPFDAFGVSFVVDL